MTPDRLLLCESALTQLAPLIKELDRVAPDTGKKGFVEAFEKIGVAAEGRAQVRGQHMATAIMPVNLPKNRYTDVLPYEDSRVVLGGGVRSPMDGSDYINASHVHTDPLDPLIPRYLAAQGPLTETAEQFWEMVWEQRVGAVIMLTREVERSRVKCSPYFPSKLGSHKRFGCLRVLNEGAEEIGDGGTIKRKMKVENEKFPESPLSLLHLHFLDWPDHGVPRSTESIRDLIRFLRESAIYRGPFVVHCSAGIGRTGAYIAIDHTVRKLLSGNLSSLDLAETVVALRAQRAGMVQTKEQFRFCYLAVRDEIKHLIASFKNNDDSEDSA